MTKCNLSWNGVENEGALALADAIKSTDILKEIDVTNTRINTEAAVNLAKGLAVNETLMILKVTNNFFCVRGRMRTSLIRCISIRATDYGFN